MASFVCVYVCLSYRTCYCWRLPLTASVVAATATCKLLPSHALWFSLKRGCGCQGNACPRSDEWCFVQLSWVGICGSLDRAGQEPFDLLCGTSQSPRLLGDETRHDERQKLVRRMCNYCWLNVLSQWDVCSSWRQRPRIHQRCRVDLLYLIAKHSCH